MACIPKTSMMVGNNGFINLLAAADISLFTPQDKSAFITQVKAVNEFPAGAIAEQIGWNGDGINAAFAMPDGALFGAAKHGAANCISFNPQHDRFEKVGTFRGWMEGVAKPLTGLLFGEFMVIFPFVAPLLRFLPQLDNFGILLVAPKGKGKTTLLDFAASTIGGVKGSSGKPYWSLLNSTLNAFEDQMSQHRDLPLMLDDSSRTLATMDRKQAGQFMSGLAYLMEGGELAASAQVLRIAGRNDDPHLAAKASASLATLHTKSDRSELRIHPSKIEAALPGFNKANPNQAWRDLLIGGDGRHLTAKSTLAPGMDKERLYRFRLPLVAPG